MLSRQVQLKVCFSARGEQLPQHSGGRAGGHVWACKRQDRCARRALPLPVLIQHPLVAVHQLSNVHLHEVAEWQVSRVVGVWGGGAKVGAQRTARADACAALPPATSPTSCAMGASAISSASSTSRTMASSSSSSTCSQPSGSRPHK